MMEFIENGEKTSMELSEDKIVSDVTCRCINFFKKKSVELS